MLTFSVRKPHSFDIAFAIGRATPPGCAASQTPQDACSTTRSPTKTTTVAGRVRSHALGFLFFTARDPLELLQCLARVHVRMCARLSVSSASGVLCYTLPVEMTPGRKHVRLTHPVAWGYFICVSHEKNSSSSARVRTLNPGRADRQNDRVAFPSNV